MVRTALMRRILAAAGLSAMIAGGATAEEATPYLSFSAGAFDIRRDSSAELAVAYRPGYHLLWMLQPHAGLLVNSDGGVYGYAGLLIDLKLTDNLYLTPSAAVGAFNEGGGTDLGNVIEFRTGAELAWQFEDASRLGLGFYHLSNAHLSNRNPGAESVILTYSLPFSGLDL